MSLSKSMLYLNIAGACKHNPASAVLIPQTPETLKWKLRIPQLTPSVQSAMLIKKNMEYVDTHSSLFCVPLRRCSQDISWQRKWCSACFSLDYLPFLRSEQNYSIFCYFCAETALNFTQRRPPPKIHDN